MGAPGTGGVTGTIFSTLDIINSLGYTLRIAHDSSERMVVSFTTPAPGALTSALAGAGAGNVDNGLHKYRVTFVTADGETEGGTVNAGTTVADKTVDGKISLTAVPVGTSGVVTSRKIYRTTAGGSVYKLLTTLADNTTTTYTDNTADAGLGANAPTTNGTLGLGFALGKDGSDVLSVQRGANATKVRVYNTTDGTNYERGEVGWAGNVFRVVASAAGTGASRNVLIGTESSSGAVVIETNGTNRAQVNSAGCAIQVGTSTTLANAGCKLNLDVTAVGNVGGGTDNLITYSLPANAMANTASGIKIRVWGTYANNANAKTLNLLFGATSISGAISGVTAQAGTWCIEAIVVRTGAATQDTFIQYTETGTIGQHINLVGTAAETLSGAITVKCTGAGTNDNDIVQEGMLVEMLN